MPPIYNRLRGMQTGGGYLNIGPKPITLGHPGTKIPLTSGFFGDTFGGGGGGTADDFLSQLLGQGGLGGIGQTSSSSQSQVVLPPALELLAEMRARREAEAQQAKLLNDIIAGNLPRGQAYQLGFEPGGIADTLIGIITGGGPAAAQAALPQGQRSVKRTNVNVPLGQPSVQSEFGDAQSMANAILEAIRLFGVGSAQSAPVSVNLGP